MKIKITLITGTTIKFKNKKYKSLKDFIDNQISKDYYIFDVENNKALRCSNILFVEEDKE